MVEHADEVVVIVDPLANDVSITIEGDNNVTNIVLLSPGASITTGSSEVVSNGEIEVNE